MSQVESVSRTGVAAFALGTVALLLALVTVWQAHGNRNLQRQAADAQMRLAKGQAMANLDNNLVQMLAKAVVDTNDADLRALLERNGVWLKTGADAAPALAGQ